MIASRLQRIIAWELLTLFLLSLAVVSVVLMGLAAALLASTQGVAPNKLFPFMPLLAPATWPFTAPVCLLLACTIVYGRMANHNEVIAVKSAGISSLRLLTPGLVLGIVCSIGLVVVGDRLIPYCGEQLAQSILNDLRSTLNEHLRQKGSLSFPGFPYEMYVQTVRDGKLIHPLFKHRKPTGEHDLLAQAEEAELDVQQRNGELVIIATLREGAASSGNDHAVHFRQRVLEIPVPDPLKKQTLNLSSLSFTGCAERRRQHEREQQAAALLAHSLSAQHMLHGNAAQAVQHVPAMAFEVKNTGWSMRKADAEIHGRLARSISPLLFVLLGGSVSIVARRREFLDTFFVCFLPVIAGFYPALLFASNVYQSGIIFTPLILWAPVVLAFLIALPFVSLVHRH